LLERIPRCSDRAFYLNSASAPTNLHNDLHYRKRCWSEDQDRKGSEESEREGGGGGRRHPKDRHPTSVLHFQPRESERTHTHSLAGSESGYEEVKREEEEEIAVMERDSW
jgi:hypothetical protein